jgi:broad specificity phosphatase PhoE
MEGRKILLIRHGTVDKQAVGIGVPRIYGPNEPLDEHGIHQGKRLAENLISQGITPDRIYTSQFERAHQTANILQETFPNHPQIIVDAQLNGAHTPQWDHRPETELALAGGNLFADNALVPDLHGETLPHTYERAISEYKRLLQLHKNETVALVTHGEIIGMIMHYLSTGEFGQPGIDRSIEKGEALVLTYNTEGQLIEYCTVSNEGYPRTLERLR